MGETITEQEKNLADNIWSQDFKDLAGAWKDLPIAEDIRQETTGVEVVEQSV